MTHRVNLPARPVLLAGVTLVALALGCSKTDGATTATPSDTSSGGAGAGTSPGATAGTGAFPGAGGAGTCEGGVVADGKRVVRLSFNQLSRTIHTLLGDTFGAKADADFEIGAESPTARTFPPLSSPQEGSTLTTGIWQKSDLIASAAGSYSLSNLNQLTGCGAAPSDACAQAFVRSFAE